MNFEEVLKLGGVQHDFFKELNQALALQLKTLLETKHLYQRVSVEADAVRIVSEIRDRNFPDQKGIPIPKETIEKFAQQRSLVPTDEPGSRPLSPGGPILILKHAKIFCSTCDAREAFRPVWFVEVSNELRKIDRGGVSPNSLVGFQLFALAYQCQRCLGTPVSFLVGHDGWHFTLEGRSPFEQLEIPLFIPKSERHLYREAMIAINAGKTLAALFYLRTFIEQFARRQTGKDGRLTGDELMAAYSETLPPQHRGHIPSLGDWYGQLSKALHEASEDSELFESARTKILEHFDIRRVFKIPDTTVKAVAGL